MAGSLPGIPLSQQFDASGRLLRGCFLYIYAANTTTPQTAFQDSGLTIPHPWPVPADGSGRLPMFYLADGAVHVKLLDSFGVQQFDYPSMLVIGPSSGGGGGGGVDPNAIFQTGDVIWLDQSGVRAGWVRDNGRTIGNATSGASERAATDAQALFIFVYNTYPDTLCPVTGGRTGNALNDFNAGKQITLPDKRGFSPGGVTDMGNADSGRLAGVPFIGVGSGPTVAGSLGGEARHTLLKVELPTIIGVSQENNVPYNLSGPINSNTPPAGGIQLPFWAASVNLTGTTGVTIINPAGGNAHNVTGLIVLGTFYRKL